MANYRIVNTGVIFLTVVISAINLGVFTTTLPDMEVRTSSNTAEMATTFIWIGVAMVVGSLVIGPLFDHVNGMLLLAVCLTLEGICMGLAPTWPVLAAFQIFVATTIAIHVSVFSGALSINRNAWKMSQSWKRPVIQATTVAQMFGVGLGPQIARPFVGHSLHIQSNDTVNVTSSTLQTGNQGLHPVQVAYMIAGVLDISMAIVCMIACAVDSVGNGHCMEGLSKCLKRDSELDDVQLIPDSTDTSANSIEVSKLEPWSRPGCVLLVMIYPLCAVSGALEVLMTGLLFTYLFEYLLWSVNAATVLVTAYHMTRFVVGLAVVVASRSLSPIRQKIFNLVALSVASVLMLLASVADGDLLTVAGTIVTAIGVCSFFPTTVTMVEQSVDVTAAVTAMLVSTTGFGVAVSTTVAGALLHGVGAPAFPATLSTLTLTGLVVFVLYSISLRII